MKRIKLGELATFNMGQSPISSSISNTEGSVPFLQGSAEFGPITPVHRLYCSKPIKLCKPSDLLISVRAPVGALNKADRIYCIGRGLAAVCFVEALPNFGWHLLNYWANDLRIVAQGSTFEAISKTDLENLWVICPSDQDQYYIAQILDILDTQIQETSKLIAKLKQVKIGLLHDLLSRGVNEGGEVRDPVAHLGEFKEVFQEKVKIPREWKILQVKEVGNVQLGRQRSPVHQTGRYTTSYLRVANVFDGWIDYSDVLQMDFTPEEREIYTLVPGDILLNEGQSMELVGRCAIYKGPPNTYCFQNTLVCFRCYAHAIPEYCQAVFKHWLDTGKFTLIAKQTTSVAHLGADRFAKMTLFLPTLNEQRRIVAILSIHDARIASEEANLNKLKQIKKGLMHDLLTGRVRVTQLIVDEEKGTSLLPSSNRDK